MFENRDLENFPFHFVAVFIVVVVAFFCLVDCLFILYYLINHFLLGSTHSQ